MSEKRASRVSTTQSLSAISENGVADDDMVDVHVTTAPDGGYGWVIVCTSFLCFVVVDGTIFSMGRFLEEFEKHFNSSKSKTAWVASIMSGWYLLVGPIAAGLSNALGCRVVAILGSVLAAAGLALSASASTISQLYFTAGCMTGIGFGFIYLPAACTISFYFEKKRAFATGIAVCGSGMGGFILGPVTNWLVNELGWQSSLYVLACMALSCSFITALFKPLNAAELPDNQDDEDATEETKHLNNNNTNMNTEKSGTPSFPNGNVKNAQNGSTPSLVVNEAIAAAKFRSNFELNTDYRHSMDGASHKGSTPVGSQHELRKMGSNAKMIGASRKSVYHHRSKLSIDYGALRARGLSLASLSTERRLTQPDLKPMLRKDVFLSASLQRIPEYRSQTNINDYHASVLHIPTLLGDDNQQKMCGCIPQSLIDALKSMLSFNLLKSPSFWILALSGFLTMMGFFIPFLYLCKAATSKGVEKDKAVVLLAVIGITNTAGRVFCGWVSDLPKVNALAINNVALIGGGIATALLPNLLMKSFGLLCVYAAIFGFSIACFAALRSIIVVELFGLEKLTNAFGLLLLFQGVASLIGSPFAGLLYDLSGSYNLTFYFFGAVIAASGLMCLPVSAVMKWERRSKIHRSDVEMSCGQLSEC
ncbi:monocarboxylate transporter 12-like isoform X3 [Varroa jacobsoni]|nr:monocarboxylate transporter 12-like isoform X2 [Varroa destructor]XP_022648693.1 monocarboxylate transporter 12-like isoform X2 [Varroa destructor]XP_022692520.1 monocarboxylate transporter 12-like isoform X3 [Varroa jacobsoni]XP_022692521.1 monocarboxylate transporter 12-like isoform X3 [Varroa jacobsoni]